jgi:hypothetical protein
VSSSALLATAKALATDAVCAEVVAALQGKGVDPILLKGSTFADWLYRDEVRVSGDVDLLVQPERIADAATVLETLGFVPYHRHVSTHAHPWIRSSDGAEIDLHISPFGPNRPPDYVWRELQGWTETKRIGAVSVRVLNLPARAMHVALHAHQHHEHEPAKRLEDLRRALAQAPFDMWLRAEALADRLWALAEMAEGLLLDPAGQELVQRLPLVRAAAMVLHQHAPLALGFARIANAKGPVAKLRTLLRLTFPPPGELGAFSDTPTPTGMGLVLAYPRRLMSLLVRAPGTLIAMASASRLRKQ